MNLIDPSGQFSNFSNKTYMCGLGIKKQKGKEKQMMLKMNMMLMNMSDTKC